METLPNELFLYIVSYLEKNNKLLDMVAISKKTYNLLIEKIYWIKCLSGFIPIDTVHGAYPSRYIIHNCFNIITENEKMELIFDYIYRDANILIAGYLVVLMHLDKFTEDTKTGLNVFILEHDTAYRKTYQKFIAFIEEVFTDIYIHTHGRNTDVYIKGYRKIRITQTKYKDIFRLMLGFNSAHMRCAIYKGDAICLIDAQWAKKMNRTIIYTNTREHGYMTEDRYDIYGIDCLDNIVSMGLDLFSLDTQKNLENIGGKILPVAQDMYSILQDDIEFRKYPIIGIRFDTFIKNYAKFTVVPDRVGPYNIWYAYSCPNTNGIVMDLQTGPYLLLPLIELCLYICDEDGLSVMIAKEHTSTIIQLLNKIGTDCHNTDWWIVEGAFMPILSVSSRDVLSLLLECSNTPLDLRTLCTISIKESVLGNTDIISRSFIMEIHDIIDIL